MTPPPAALAIAEPHLADTMAAHPLEASDRLAAQATAAVGLLERFGDLVLVALDAAGEADDDLLRAALDERERLTVQLGPLLADLAAARQQVSRDEVAGPNARRALATILYPVDQALRYAKLLHARLADEVPLRAAPGATPVRRGPLTLVK